MGCVSESVEDRDRGGGRGWVYENVRVRERGGREV